MDATVDAGRAGEAASRAALGSLLARVFRRPLDADLLARLRGSPLREGLAEAGVRLGEDFFAAPADDLRETLAVDFTALFHGPRDHLPPYESVQTAPAGHGELYGEAAVRAQRFYRACGLVRDESDREFPDHLSVELECLAELARLEAEALEAGDAGAARRRALEQRLFVGGHLGRWVPEYAERVAEKAGTDFYREMARLLGDFVAAEERRAAENGPAEAGDLERTIA